MIPNYASNLTQKVFQIPALNVASAETVSVAFFEAMGALSHLRFAPEYTVSACVQHALTTYKANNNQCHYNTLTPLYNPYAWDPPGLALKASHEAAADVVLDSSISNSDAKRITFFASTDPGPLNRAEWIKFVGAVVNEDMLAYEFYKYEKIRYQDLSLRARAASASGQKRVAFVQHSAAYPSWGLPGYYEISLATYKKNTIEDAGGIAPVAADFASLLTPGKLETAASYRFSYGNLEKFADQGTAAKAFLDAIDTWGADILIDETYAWNPSSYTKATFEETFCIDALSVTCNANFTGTIKAFSDATGALVREDRVLSTYSSGSLDFYESAIARPSRLLGDLAMYTAPGTSGGAQYFFRNLNRGETVVPVDPATCRSPMLQCCDTGVECPSTLLNSPSSGAVGEGVGRGMMVAVVAVVVALMMTSTTTVAALAF